MNGKLWIQTHIATSFQKDILYVCKLMSWKLWVVHGCSMYQRTALLSETFIFWVRASCEIWLVSYGSKHALQCFSDKPFVSIFTQLKKYRSYIDVQHLEWLLYYQRHSLCGLELHKRFKWSATCPEIPAQVILWYSENTVGTCTCMCI